ncbi:MAG TPA: response regulator [Ruminiclostridium sp.]
MYKVTIVDDEPSIISSIKRIINKTTEFTVISEEYSVDKCIENLPKNKPDIIFTDIRMPGKSGIELIKYLSNNYKDIVVIVVSGFDDFEYVREAFIYGVEDYILKPVHPTKFLDLLNSLYIKINNKNLKIVKNLADIIDCNRSTSVSEKMVYDIEEYMKNNLTQDISISAVCTHFSISQPYLSKIFKKYKTCTYNDFLINIKISKAKQLLKDRPDLLIGTIAELSGFTDQFYFSKVFKSIENTTPSEYRRFILSC